MLKKESWTANKFDEVCVELGVYKQNISTRGIPLGNGALGKNEEEGAPDRNCCYKGRFIAVELKRPKGGKYSVKQLFRKLQIENAGGIWLGIHDEDGIQKFRDTIKSLT